MRTMHGNPVRRSTYVRNSQPWHERGQRLYCGRGMSPCGRSSTAHVVERLDVLDTAGNHARCARCPRSASANTQSAERDFSCGRFRGATCAGRSEFVVSERMERRSAVPSEQRRNRLTVARDRFSTVSNTRATCFVQWESLQ